MTASIQMKVISLLALSRKWLTMITAMIYDDGVCSHVDVYMEKDSLAEMTLGRTSHSHFQLKSNSETICA